MTWETSPLDTLGTPPGEEKQEPAFVTPDGVPVPLSKALEAVDRCVRGIRVLDHYLALLKQGHADEQSLVPFQQVREVLTGSADAADPSEG